MKKGKPHAEISQTNLVLHKRSAAHLVRGTRMWSDEKGMRSKKTKGAEEEKL
jgi:hypothetical protein